MSSSDGKTLKIVFAGSWDFGMSDWSTTAYNMWVQEIKLCTDSEVVPTRVNDDATGTGNNQFNYVGSWSDQNNKTGMNNDDNHNSNTNYNYFTFKFTGTRAELYAYAGTVAPNVTITVDDVPQSVTSFYNSKEFVSKKVFATGTLSNTTHTIKVTNNGDVSKWLLVDCIDVYSPSATPTPTPTPTPAVTIDDNTTGTGTNQFEYVSAWSVETNRINAYNSTEHYSNTNNAYINVRFNGTRIKFYSSKAADMGKAAISIDGSTESVVDFYNSSKQWQQLIFDSGTLSSGSHTLKIRLNGQKNASSSNYWICADKVEIN